ncbi:MAG: TIGR03986 family CRISPR-associated RAMP protein [Actinobacteria bacterium]|nr:TIGR03986 family CRISPR-associated RAMP protein [Actinomycetota bacterium]MCL5446672.1 TIGR03986 family CRISPR-associated RAMP protein [Actinomycetota bacterium]
MKGTLRIEEHYGEQQLRLYPDATSKSRQTSRKQLENSLANLPESELDGMTVEFDEHKGQYRNIRREGTSPVPSVAPNPNPSSSSAAMENMSNNLKNDQFLNPYNFVPAPSRPQEDSKSPLADSMPLGHDRLGHDRWSGRISVYMKTVTPLLVLDTESFTVNDKGHRTYSIKTKPNGEPHIAPTSIKGMLRAAYEAVTNSRFGIFTGHEKLGYRDRDGKKEFALAPDKLLRDDHRPADKLGKLSPADRVFGWVAQRADDNHTDDYGAYRGNLRVGPVSCKQDGKEAIEEFDHPLPLAILAAPKPQQGRFYLGNQGKDGATPITSGIEKSKFYSSGQTLRGRKVYLHHAGLLDGYWDPAWNDRKPRGGRFQEYRLSDGESSKPDGDTSDQNRSITKWIRPNVSFQFTLDVKNLSDVELGALVWLLNLPEGHMHRLGYGKPLGFGSVQLSIDWQVTKLCKGGEVKSTSEQTWSAYWKSLGDGSSGAGLSDGTLLPAEPKEAIEATVNSFKETVTGTGAGEEFEEQFEKVSFIRAFLAVSQGNSSMRVHYPRVRKDNSPPPPDPESFRWFTENEKTGNQKSLPLPSSNEGLPYYDTSRQGGGQRGTHDGNRGNSSRQRPRNNRNK